MQGWTCLILSPPPELGAFSVDSLLNVMLQPARVILDAFRNDGTSSKKWKRQSWNPPAALLPQHSM